MKCVIVLCLIGSSLAELPRFTPARFRFQRQEIAPTTTDTPTESTTDVTAPYPPSGWRPSGEPFTLPDQTDATPTDTYGPPAPYPPSGWKPAGQAFTLPQEQTTSTPDSTYGPPGAPYPPSGWKPSGEPFALPQETTPDNSYGPPDNTYGPPEANTEKLDGPLEVQRSIGTYYVLLPNGQLQRVEFLTENDIQNMKYTARLELRDRAPLYVFGP
ncbi:extensin-like [Pieris brassicae]|uniref:extensin-like n=1 Tax=Pieris brassicae TaxID=7116 RepID=UPI001E65E7C9|nr:extensin-like [Pieris brassicae]